MLCFLARSQIARRGPLWFILNGVLQGPPGEGTPEAAAGHRPAVGRHPAHAVASYAPAERVRRCRCTEEVATCAVHNVDLAMRAASMVG